MSNLLFSQIFVPKKPDATTILAIVLRALLVEPLLVMLLWNWQIVPAFDAPRISFWLALVICLIVRFAK